MVKEKRGGIRKDGPGQHTANAINESTYSTKQPLYSPLPNKDTDIVNKQYDHRLLRKKWESSTVCLSFLSCFFVDSGMLLGTLTRLRLNRFELGPSSDGFDWCGVSAGSPLSLTSTCGAVSCFPLFAAGTLGLLRSRLETVIVGA